MSPTVQFSEGPSLEIIEEWAERLECADNGVDYPLLGDDGQSCWGDQDETTQDYYRTLAKVMYDAGLHRVMDRWVCTGASDCSASVHIHGCYADTSGRCTDPSDHDQSLAAEIRRQVAQEILTIADTYPKRDDEGQTEFALRMARA